MAHSNFLVAVRFLFYKHRYVLLKRLAVIMTNVKVLSAVCAYLFSVLLSSLKGKGSQLLAFIDVTY